MNNDNAGLSVSMTAENHKQIDVEVARRRRYFQLALADAFKRAPILRRVLGQTASTDIAAVGAEAAASIAATDKGATILSAGTGSRRSYLSTIDQYTALGVPTVLRMCCSRHTFLEATRARLDAYEEAAQHATRWRRERLQLKRRKLDILQERYENGFRHTHALVVESRERLRDVQRSKRAQAGPFDKTSTKLSPSIQEIASTAAIPSTRTASGTRAEMRPSVRAPGDVNVGERYPSTSVRAARVRFVMQLERQRYKHKLRIIELRRNLEATRSARIGLQRRRARFSEKAFAGNGEAVEGRSSTAGMRSVMESTVDDNVVSRQCRDTVYEIVERACDISDAEPSLESVRRAIKTHASRESRIAIALRQVPLQTELLLIDTIVEMCTDVVEEHFERFDVLQRNARAIAVMGYARAVDSARADRRRAEDKRDQKSHASDVSGSSRGHAETDGVGIYDNGYTRDGSYDEEEEEEEYDDLSNGLAHVDEDEAVFDNFKDDGDDTNDADLDEHDNSSVPFLLYNELVIRSMSPLRIHDPYDDIRHASQRHYHRTGVFRSLARLGVSVDGAGAVAMPVKRKQPIIRTYTSDTKGRHADALQSRSPQSRSVLPPPPSDDIFALPTSAVRTHSSATATSLSHSRADQHAFHDERRRGHDNDDDDEREIAARRSALLRIFDRSCAYWDRIGLKEDDPATAQRMMRKLSRSRSLRVAHVADQRSRRVKRIEQHQHFRLCLPDRGGLLRCCAVSPSNKMLAVCATSGLLLYQLGSQLLPSYSTASMTTANDAASGSNTSAADSKERQLLHEPVLLSAVYGRRKGDLEFVGVSWSGNTHIVAVTEFDDIAVYQLLPPTASSSSRRGVQEGRRERADAQHAHNGSDSDGERPSGLFGRGRRGRSGRGRRGKGMNTNGSDGGINDEPVLARAELSLVLHVPHDGTVSFSDSRWMSFASNVTVYKSPVIHPAMTVTGYQPNVLVASVFGDIVRFELLGKNYKIVYAGSDLRVRHRPRARRHDFDTTSSRRNRDWNATSTLVLAPSRNRTLMWTGDATASPFSSSAARMGPRASAAFGRRPTRRRHSVMSTFVRSSGTRGVDGSEKGAVVGQTLYRGHNSSVVFATFLSRSSRGASGAMEESSTMLTVDDSGCCLVWPSTYDSNNGFGWVEPSERYDVPLLVRELSIRSSSSSSSGTRGGGGSRPVTPGASLSDSEDIAESDADNDTGVSAATGSSQTFAHDGARVPPAQSSASTGSSRAGFGMRNAEAFVAEAVDVDEYYDYMSCIRSESLWFLSYSWPKTKLSANKNLALRQQECIRHVVERRQDAYDPSKQQARIVSTMPDGQVLHKQRIALERREIRCTLSSACTVSGGTELLIVLGIPRGYGLSQFRVLVMPIHNDAAVQWTQSTNRIDVEDFNNIGSYGLLSGHVRIAMEVGDYSNGAAPPCYTIWRNALQGIDGSARGNSSSGSAGAPISTSEDATETLLFSLGCMRIGVYCLTAGKMIRDVDLTDLIFAQGDAKVKTKAKKRTDAGRHITYMSTQKLQDVHAPSAEVQVLFVCIDDSNELIAIRLDDTDGSPAALYPTRGPV